MAIEIERKFLVVDASWRDTAAPGTEFRQGYLSLDPERIIRVRIAGPTAYLNVKGRTVGVSRQEFEYEIPLDDARQLLTLCGRSLVLKTRHLLWHGNHRWEIDEFQGDNAGLVVAEVELADAEEEIELPPWVGREVSHDPRYYNSNLSQHPYREWRDDS